HHRGKDKLRQGTAMEGAKGFLEPRVVETLDVDVGVEEKHGYLRSLSSSKGSTNPPRPRRSSRPASDSARKRASSLTASSARLMASVSVAAWRTSRARSI